MSESLSARNSTRNHLWHGIIENDILKILEIIRPFLNTSQAKNNITRISNKLFKAI